MPKLSPIKAKMIIRIFLKLDFYVHHQRGSHVQLRNYNKSHLRVTIPRHDKFDLQPSIIISILKQAEIDRNDFLKLLRKK